ncbi:MAG TPA: methylated-DNA--[protein]-cysteine S-methyltransferase [Castellaniella sp.]|nr:methylated-DNA--[protein]-cysteine S-methyltransferase [Castellaniella sp.]
MSFQALVASPLGDILLTADAAGLTGLYFTDQRDCPRLAGVAAAGDIISRPSAGTREGRQTRRFRAVPAAGGELFPAPGASGDPDASGLVAAPRFLQAGMPAGPRAVLEQTCRELDEYWRGRRRVFDMPLNPHGTGFQQRVWRALLDVPCGATLSYGELALQAGLSAGHGRAVGTAVGSNPISIVIPCHRILARDGTLNGYGGGLDRKIRLLEIEGFAIRA